MLPSKADVDKQEPFKKEQLEPILDEAKKGEHAVYFVEAENEVLAPFLGMEFLSFIY